jgi:hypothetical protein
VGMTIKFIDSDATLVSLLAACRDFNEVLKDEVIK